jgi:hypothetical protein
VTGQVDVTLADSQRYLRVGAAMTRNRPVALLSLPNLAPARPRSCRRQSWPRVERDSHRDGQRPHLQAVPDPHGVVVGVLSFRLGAPWGLPVRRGGA